MSFWRRALPLAGASAGFCAGEPQPRCFFSREAPKPPSVVAAAVVFRHGARAPVFQLPDCETPAPHYPTITSAPAHARAVDVVGGHKWNRGEGTHGLLTTVGWAQGEALGRRIRARYGPIELARVACRRR